MVCNVNEHGDDGLGNLCHLTRETVTLSPNVQMVSSPVQLSQCQSRDQSFFVLTGQYPSADLYRYDKS